MTKDLAKFEPDDFDTHEDACFNLLAQTYGVLKEPIRYVVHPEAVPNDFQNEEEERMFRIPLVGAAFESDNRAVYRKLKRSSLIPLDGRGLSHSIGWKMDAKPFAHGPIIIMAKAT